MMKEENHINYFIEEEIDKDTSVEKFDRSKKRGLYAY